MKKVIILLSIITVFTACKNDAKKEIEKEVIAEDKVDIGEKTAKQNDGLTTLRGDYIYYADAAVLQTPTEVYGVVIDEKLHELEKQAKPLKVEATDMVKVTVRGEISPKPESEEGWPFRVTIKEIIKVEKLNPKENDVIKLGS
ncbi:hypothetical protein [Ichthyenterobacterium magnum]|uniref:NlpE-like protein n=1 Tax=Ichthyenterobacterium magnum TaxID=1230530 RepID=A0A420DWS3_9FLAO|nr:hypothetical protein [Ichthyenterobacterium magnum]RKE98688.1 NlpE-like protein [Ichthyenterobacterium magnum]